MADLFQLAGVPDLAPRYNIAPTQTVLAIGLDKAGRRNTATFRWGLVPRWAADVKLVPINARSETAAAKPMFAEALRQRRCLIPADGSTSGCVRGRRNSRSVSARRRPAVRVRGDLGGVASRIRPAAADMRHPDHNGERAGAAGA